jgi:4'-phosphopantetheinyl transferase EntD
VSTDIAPSHVPGGRPTLAAVLPFASVVVCESDLRTTDERLLPEELTIQRRFTSEKRRREFAAGRRCARTALAALGIHDFPLVPGKDRAPIWPASLVGSITHTEDSAAGYCGVTVARCEHIRALGIDAEPHVRLPRDLWKRVLDENEAQAALHAPDPGVYARLVFSAKEAIYKALYPMLRRFLDFSDVHIDCLVNDGVFSAELRGAARSVELAETKLLGRFVIEHALIMTGIALAAGGLQRAPRRRPPQHVPS